MKIYIVEGQTGEYSDHRRWNVCAYMNEQSARDKVMRLEENARLAIQKWGEDAVKGLWFGDESIGKEIREFIGDPHFQSDYTGTQYHITTVDLADLGWPEASSTQ